jgi:hypothetical protein
VPFCVLNTILLDRMINSRNDPTLLPKQRLCSAEYTTRFLPLLLVLLTSVGALVYKLMHLVHLPRIWLEHQRLAVERTELEQCEEAITRRMGALGAEGAVQFERDEAAAAGELPVLRGPEPAGIGRIAVGSVGRAHRLCSAHAAAAEPELEMAGFDSRGAPLVDLCLACTRPQAAATPSRIGQSRAPVSGARDSGRGLLDVQERTGSGSTPTAMMRSPSRDRSLERTGKGAARCFGSGVFTVAAM